MILFFLSISTPFSLAKKMEPEAAVKADWSFVEKRLHQSKLSPGFIRDLKKNYENKHFETVLKLNILLFLVTSNYHGVQVTEEGVKNVRSFLAKNEKIFLRAEKEFGVSRYVIASLLWIETRHGQNQGSFHVASTYLHLLQAESPQSVRFLQSKASEFSSKVTARQRLEIKKRTHTKAEWALQELLALEKIYKKDKKLALQLRGSFSGAFGLPQFLPSSYGVWARSHSLKAADLYRADDAILSVACYLQKHGWRQKKKASYVTALMKYNKSRDYANAILKLADQSKIKTLSGKRLPSSQKKK